MKEDSQSTVDSRTGSTPVGATSLGNYIFSGLQTRNYAAVLVGWVAAGPCRDDDRPQSHQGEVYACYVLPQRWRQGVGRLLFTHAAGVLAQAGRGDITLWVLEANSPARRFYESFGFHRDGGRQILDLGGPVAEVRYRRPAVR